MPSTSAIDPANSQKNSAAIVKRPFLIFLPAIALLTLTGCPKKPAINNEAVPLVEGKISGGVYTNADLGWSMKIPDGWQVKNQADIAALTKKGLDAMQKSVDGPIEAEDNAELLFLELDKFNRFTSTAKPFDPAMDGSYAESQELLEQLILKTYADMGMKTSHERRKETLGAVEFIVLDITIFAPDGKKVILHQSLYDALLGDRSLTISLNWNTDKARDALFHAWRASTFTPVTKVTAPASATR